MLSDDPAGHLAWQMLAPWWFIVRYIQHMSLRARVGSDHDGGRRNPKRISSQVNPAGNWHVPRRYIMSSALSGFQASSQSKVVPAGHAAEGEGKGG